VYLDAFEIDRLEVTNAEYRAFVVDSGTTAPRYWEGADYPAGTGAEPVVGVGWQQACAYCDWVGERLPTEAEWEKACRGTDGAVYPWGDSWGVAPANVRWAATGRIDDAWALLAFEELGAPGLRPVGSYPNGASPYGAMDMAGNASEWVADWYWTGYADQPIRNPVGTGPEWNHSIRGSAWFNLRAGSAELGDASRCSSRNSSHSYDDPRVGFRCARSVGMDLATPATMAPPVDRPTAACRTSTVRPSPP
jgi:formylglycine-generating enzyme required for sulfatase activity